MSYYTERHGLRTPIKPTYTVIVEMYYLLFNCCQKYYNHIAWVFPEQCQDGQGCCGVNYKQLNTSLKFEIPGLYRDYSGNIGTPTGNNNIWGDNDESEYDQYALLDYIEYIAKHVKDVTVGNFHSYFGHYHLTLLPTENVFITFQNEINSIFINVGLQYRLTSKKIIERIIEDSMISEETEMQLQQITETGTKDLLKDAITLYKTPDPAARQASVEKIWDTLERLKTYYTKLDKKDSVTKLVNDMAAGKDDFITLFDEEFRTLTKIGNSFRIRHHETSKIDIIDSRHYDYFFNRCLALIALAIQYL